MKKQKITKNIDIAEDGMEFITEEALEEGLKRGLEQIKKQGS